MRPTISPFIVLLSVLQISFAIVLDFGAPGVADKSPVTQQQQPNDAIRVRQVQRADIVKRATRTGPAKRATSPVPLQYQYLYAVESRKYITLQTPYTTNGAYQYTILKYSDTVKDANSQFAVDSSSRLVSNNALGWYITVDTGRSTDYDFLYAMDQPTETAFGFKTASCQFTAGVLSCTIPALNNNPRPFCALTNSNGVYISLTSSNNYCQSLGGSVITIKAG